MPNMQLIATIPHKVLLLTRSTVADQPQYITLMNENTNQLELVRIKKKSPFLIHGSSGLLVPDFFRQRSSTFAFLLISFYFINEIANFKTSLCIFFSFQKSSKKLFLHFLHAIIWKASLAVHFLNSYTVQRCMFVTKDFSNTNIIEMNRVRLFSCLLIISTIIVRHNQHVNLFMHFITSGKLWNSYTMKTNAIASSM